MMNFSLLCMKIQNATMMILACIFEEL